MRKLTTWFEIPFSSKEISVDEISAFTADHLPRMIANNPTGKLDDRIAATTAAVQMFETQFSADLVKVGVRKASMLGKEAYRKTIPAKMEYFDSAITVKLGAGSTVHMECFPQGRNVFNKCTDDAVENHLDTVIAGLTAHAADLPGLATEASSFKGNWITVYDGSKTAMGAKAATQDTKNAAKAALALQLFLNLLEIAKLFPGQPEKLAIYMQQSLLENKTKSAGDATQPQPPAPTP